MADTVLLIDCSDAKGIVAKVTTALYERDCSVVENGEFVDAATSRFFMRTAFKGDIDQHDLITSLRAQLPGDADVRMAASARKRIVILATKEAHCLGDLLIRCNYDGLPAEICAVVSNHNALETLSARFDVPYHCVPTADLSRSDHEARVSAVIDEYAPDYIVLAKYMRILTSGFTDRYANRIINIHHSFLPAFIGANPYRQAFDRGVKIIGATAHFATSDLDEGPIIAQSIIPVDHSHSPKSMARAGRDVEKTVLAKALEYVIEDRVFVSGNKTVIFS